MSEILTKKNGGAFEPPVKQRLKVWINICFEQYDFACNGVRAFQKEVEMRFGMRLAIVAMFAVSVVPLLAQNASATPIVLDFEGLQSQEAIQDFYNGGTGSLGSSGTNYGISFSANSLALTETDPGANFTNEPSYQTIAFFLNGTADTMNVAAGFTTGFSFYYTSTTFAGSVNVFDGLNGTGNLLGTLNLSALGACGGANAFCNWATIGVTFAGVAHSVDFAGVANQIGFDNITLGSATPGGGGSVPIPGTGLFFGIGFLGFALWHWRFNGSRMTPSQLSA